MKPGIRRRSSKPDDITIPYPVVFFLVVGLLLYLTDAPLAVNGVPLSLLLDSFEDPEVRSAFMAGNRAELRNHLKQIQLDEKLDEYYRKRIPDPRARELYIDQQFYNATGYISPEYLVAPDGSLVWKDEVLLE